MYKKTLATMAASAPSTSPLTGSKLTYFPMPGRGEASRLAMAIAGVEFEDERVPFKEWGALKPQTPWGQMPVLTMADGTQYGQARSILRFIGKFSNLYPEDPLEALKVDSLMDACDEFQSITNSVGQGLPQEEKEAARLAACSDGGKIAARLAQLEAFIAANGSGGFAVGDSLSVGDLQLFAITGMVACGFFDGVPPTVNDPYPNIQAVRKNVATQEAVMAYYDARIAAGDIGDAEKFLSDSRDIAL